MPKPTSTALNVNDNFSDSDVNPQYGDAAGHGQTALKPNATTAGGARSAHPAALNPADHAQQITLRRSCAITVNVYDNYFDPSNGEVTKCGTVKLVYKGSGAGVSVLTSQGGAPKAVFTTGTNPYPADGTVYTLDPNITGDIKIEIMTASLAPNTAGYRHRDDHCDGGVNGTINVGN